MVNLRNLADARASIAYVINDAGTALRNEIDMLINGGGSDRNIAKYTGEIRYAQDIGYQLTGLEAGANLALGTNASRAVAAEKLNALANEVNVNGLTRMRLDRDERIEASRMSA